MQERLIVKNFGPIKEVDLDLSQTTIFIGEQASGKSTLAKLIGIFRELNNVDSLNTDFWGEFNDFLMTGFFNANTYFEYKNESKHFIVADNNFQKIDIKSKTIKELIYVPAERNLIPIISEAIFKFVKERVGIPQTILSFGNEFLYARKQIPNFKFLDFEYHFYDKTNFILRNNIVVELVTASSGLQTLVPMLLVIEHLSKNDNSHFVIEEPELNLYPTTQHNLTKFIAAKCTSNNQQLTITTHSPYLLSSMNILLFAHQAGQIDEAEASKIIPKESWINPKNFNAYFIEKGGTARPIFDKKSGMIAENELDNVSLDLGDEFDKLMDIYQGVTA